MTGREIEAKLGVDKRVVPALQRSSVPSRPKQQSQSSWIYRLPSPERRTELAG